MIEFDMSDEETPKWYDGIGIYFLMLFASILLTFLAI